MKAEIIPIAYLAVVTSTLKEAGFKFRVRYRGPRVAKWRKHKGVPYWRPESMRRQDCLKEDATGFRVYFP